MKNRLISILTELVVICRMDPDPVATNKEIDKAVANIESLYEAQLRDKDETIRYQEQSNLPVFLRGSP